MGRKHYCDYCQKHIQRDPDIVRKHNEGITHLRSKAAHFERFKDPTAILKETLKKKPCRRLFSLEECPFGAACRYSHYRPEEVKKLQQQARWLEEHKTKRTADILEKLCAADAITENFLSKRSEKQAKESSEFKPFWTYRKESNEINLPPSLQEIDPARIDFNSFVGWG
ncbi:zinc finger matrin-type protein 5 [Topomyia yanbarensis]|uniref:zinc finger matrin-type protein 5 n=1 Tax=Topomyia yanbarensis TaxID=2498891 RepID=UPI00273CC582|nr:zinc finger matrin-type protein 5 [Topomyia yanbarensis]